MNHLKYTLLLLAISVIGYCSAFDSPITDNSPVLIQSMNHKHYVVSIPKKFNGTERYAAVFKNGTKELVFKVDSLDTWDLKVSNDGKFIYALTFEMDSNIQNWYIEQYSATSKSSKHFIHKVELIQMDNGNYIYQNLSWELFSDRIEMIGEEKATMLLNDFTVQTTELKPETNKRPVIIEVDWLADLPFELDSLKHKNASFFSGDLLLFLGYKAGYDKNSSQKYVFIKFIMLEDGTISDLHVFVQNGKMAPERVGELDTNMIEKIKTYISKYKFSKETVPDGVPYWYYSGKLYLVK
jgi:hypothetical protein